MSIHDNKWCVLPYLAVVLMAAVAAAEGVTMDGEPKLDKLDPNMAVPGVDGNTRWYDAAHLGIEGQAWQDTKHRFDRLPGKSEGVVPDPVWRLAQHSAGLHVRFVTDSDTVAARWTLRFESLAMGHMAATGVSGLDLYVKDGERWRWAGVGRPSEFPTNETTLAAGMPPGRHEYLLYFPLYNGVESVEIGIDADAELAKAPAYPAERAKSICFYGTSIVHGGCASRPGMAYPAILARRLGRPVINLGFSGNGKMELELAELLSELDAALYVVDCAPNMNPEMLTERVEPFVKALRQARPDTPIVLVENVVYQNAWFNKARHEGYTEKNAALRKAYENLRAEGVPHLSLVPCDELLGDDGEGTVDGVHPTDLGFMRMADALEPPIRAALREAGEAP